jgi:hypothetical protein
MTKMTEWTTNPQLTLAELFTVGNGGHRKGMFFESVPIAVIFVEGVRSGITRTDIDRHLGQGILNVIGDIIGSLRYNTARFDKDRHRIPIGGNTLERRSVRDLAGEIVQPISRREPYLGGGRGARSRRGSNE